MLDVDQKRDRTVFKLLAMSAKRVREGRPIKPFEVALLRKVFPDAYALYRTLTPEQITEINRQYIDHPTYGENVKVMISPKGQAWLKETLSLIKAYKE